MLTQISQLLVENLCQIIELGNETGLIIQMTPPPKKKAVFIEIAKMRLMNVHNTLLLEKSFQIINIPCSSDLRTAGICREIRAKSLPVKVVVFKYVVYLMFGSEMHAFQASSCDGSQEFDGYTVTALSKVSAP